MITQKFLPSLKAFAGPYLESRDIDPVYPVLKKVHELKKLSKSDALWHCLLYLTYYHLGSAEVVLKLYPKPIEVTQLPVLPTGIERRGFRGIVGVAKAVEFFKSIPVEQDLYEWMEGVIAGNDTIGWNNLFEYIKSLPHCGTWAAFKWCDLMKNVMGFPITSPDIGYGGGGEKAGPVPGMVLLTGYDWKTCVTDRKLQRRLYYWMKTVGIELDGLEELETILCDFNSAVKGQYYPGHDLDKQMEDISHIPGAVQELYWKARREVFPEKYLGELNGWMGVRKNLKLEWRKRIAEGE